MSRTFSRRTVLAAVTGLMASHGTRVSATSSANSRFDVERFVDDVKHARRGF